jgi:hypothetical protein
MGFVEKFRSNVDSWLPCRQHSCLNLLDEVRHRERERRNQDPSNKKLRDPPRYSVRFGTADASDSAIEP